MHTGWSFVKRASALLALVCLSARADTVVVEIQNYAYAPREVKVRVGDTVRWVNREKRTSHSIVFPAEGGKESERIFPDEAWQRTFTRAGAYPYFCGPHPEMKGSVLVEE